MKKPTTREFFKAIKCFRIKHPGMAYRARSPKLRAVLQRLNNNPDIYTVSATAGHRVYKYKGINFKDINIRAKGYADFNLCLLVNNKTITKTRNFVKLLNDRISKEFSGPLYEKVSIVVSFKDKSFKVSLVGLSTNTEKSNTPVKVKSLLIRTNMKGKDLFKFRDLVYKSLEESGLI